MNFYNALLLLVGASLCSYVAADCNLATVERNVDQLVRLRSPLSIFKVMAGDLELYCKTSKSHLSNAKTQLLDCSPSDPNEEVSFALQLLEKHYNAINPLCELNFKSRAKAEAGCLNSVSNIIFNCANVSLREIEFHRDTPSDEVCCNFEGYKACVKNISITKCDTGAEAVVTEKIHYLLQDQLIEFCKFTACPNGATTSSMSVALLLATMALAAHLLFNQLN